MNTSRRCIVRNRCIVWTRCVVWNKYVVWLRRRGCRFSKCIGCGHGWCRHGQVTYLTCSDCPWPSPTCPNPCQHVLRPTVSPAHASHVPQCVPVAPTLPRHMLTHDDVPCTPMTPSRPLEQPQWRQTCRDQVWTWSGLGPDQYRQSMMVTVPVPKILSESGLSGLWSGKNGPGPDWTELPQHWTRQHQAYCPMLV